MAGLILKIAILLRASGIQISTREIGDCLDVLCHHEETALDAGSLYRLINATMIKTPWGSDFVMWLLALYLGPDLECALNRYPAPKSPAISGGGGEDGSGKKSLREEMARSAMVGELARIHALFRKLELILDPAVEDRDLALRTFQEACGWLDAANLIAQAQAREEDRPTDLDVAIKTLARWNDLIETEVDLQLEKNMSLPFLVEKMKSHNPKTTSFVDCRDEQMAAVYGEARKLGRKMAIRKGRRLIHGRKGRVELARTIRLAMKTRLIPLDLARVAPKPSKPDLWLVCDVSNSVRKFIYFMMALVYATQKFHTRVRSFLFVDNLVESTDYFKHHAWKDSLLNLKLMKGANMTGFSDYGVVLRQFKAQFLDQLTSKTTVIVLGDARNNGRRDDGCDVLPLIRKKAAALYWLSPFAKAEWQRRDCLMDRYRPHCTGAYSCPDIHSLERFLAAIHF